MSTSVNTRDKPTSGERRIIKSYADTLDRYPDCDPFTLEIPSIEVFPTQPVVLDLEDPTLAKAQQMPRKTRPFASYLTNKNPFSGGRFLRDPKVLTPSDYKPEPLEEFPLDGHEVEFVKKICPSGRTPAYLVRIESRSYFLKVVSVQFVPKPS